jgi:hypothetical protein
LVEVAPENAPVGEADHEPADRAAFGVIGVQQGLVGDPAADQGELPAQVPGVLDAGVHALRTGGTVDVGDRDHAGLDGGAALVMVADGGTLKLSLPATRLKTRWAVPEKALWPEVYSPNGGVTTLASWGSRCRRRWWWSWRRVRSSP